MLNESTTQTEIAVRLYDNSTYGTTYGKGKFRKAIYNGTIDAKHQNLKYLVDLYSYEDWVNMAKTDAQMEIVSGISSQADALYSWMKFYDNKSKVKQDVTGMCRLDLENQKMLVLIFDQEHGLEERWDLTVRPCKENINALKSPQLLATNSDLTVW